MNIIHSENQRKKEGKTRPAISLWDHIEQLNTLVLEVLEEKGERDWGRKTFENYWLKVN